MKVNIVRLPISGIFLGLWVGSLIKPTSTDVGIVASTLFLSFFLLMLGLAFEGEK